MYCYRSSERIVPLEKVLERPGMQKRLNVAYLHSAEKIGSMLTAPSYAIYEQPSYDERLLIDMVEKLTRV